MLNNKDFLTAIFGDQYNRAHVTSFADDPTDLTDRYLWGGGRFGDIALVPGNQYFTISLFSEDDTGRARRRKSLFEACYCIVLDDVREKLSSEEVKKLPEPAWILETSAGSEQWGYILDRPCTDRGRVDNLLDGLVESDLAPQGKDPGMKGVTRYVRLPEGTNNKASKCIDGVPFKCQLWLWRPERRCTLESLAEPFLVDLDRPRHDARVDGAADIEDHPILPLIDVKSKLSPGRYDVTCPWVHEHTGAADDGACVFTNSDATVGFKCHHGACQERTAGDLLEHLETKHPGITAEINRRVITVGFSDVAVPPPPVEGQVPPPPPPTQQSVHELISILGSTLGDDPRQVDAATELVAMLPSLGTVESLCAKRALKGALGWSEKEIKDATKPKSGEKVKHDFYDKHVYVSEQNCFYNRSKNIFLSVEGFQNTYSDTDPDAKKNALQQAWCQKVDRLDYAPKKPARFFENNVVISNTWSDHSERKGKPGDVSKWLGHFDILGFSDYKKSLLQFMAYTIRHPDKKINYGVLIGGAEGIGKDFILTPLLKALGENSTTISGETLLDRFNDFVLGHKHIHVNELEPGNDVDAAKIATRLKPMLASPPDTLRSESKGIKAINVRNILSVTMTTNSKKCLKLHGQSRRLLVLWSDIVMLDQYSGLLPDWQKYWDDRWAWMDGEGVDHCIHYLRNEVDLSDFKPRQPPRVTEHLRNMMSDNVTTMFG